MASLLPLLHDLLPMFMPSKVQITRSGELVTVEERAELSPWYQQKPRIDTPMAESGPPSDRGVDRYIDVDDNNDSSSPGQAPRSLGPIQLLDHEHKGASSGYVPNEEENVADLPNSTGRASSVWPQAREGPKVFRQNAMVGVSDRMCVTGKPRLCSLMSFLPSLWPLSYLPIAFGPQRFEVDHSDLCISISGALLHLFSISSSMSIQYFQTGFPRLISCDITQF